MPQILESNFAGNSKIHRAVEFLFEVKSQFTGAVFSALTADNKSVAYGIGEDWTVENLKNADDKKSVTPAEYHAGLSTVSRQIKALFEGFIAENEGDKFEGLTVNVRIAPTPKAKNPKNPKVGNPAENWDHYMRQIANSSDAVRARNVDSVYVSFDKTPN